MKQYGEFQCKICKRVFHIKKQLDGHLGGAHRKDITKNKIPRCKHCNVILMEGKNWGLWAVKQRNLICRICKNKKNRESHSRLVQRKLEALKTRKGLGHVHN